MRPGRTRSRYERRYPLSVANGTTARHNPEQQRSRALVDDLLNATAELLGESGVDKMTMTAIAAKAGMSKAAIYRYFPNKAALIGALAERSLVEWLEIFHDAATDRSISGRETIYQGFYRYLDRHRVEPYQVQLRAAIRADPELAEKDLIEARKVAHSIALALTARNSTHPVEVIEARALLLLELCDSVIRLASMVSDDEAEVAVVDFCNLCTDHLLTKVPGRDRR